MTVDPWADILRGRSRQNGEYAKHKLTFFDRYLPPAFVATSRKLTRHYVDLFAGPGVWRDPGGHHHLGSPLKALSISADVGTGKGFTEAFLVNRDPKGHAALSVRIDNMVARGLTNLPRESIHLLGTDANEEIPTILEQIHRKSWVFVYADIEKPAQWPWTSVEALRAHAHESIDLYLLLPLEMGINRIVGYDVQHRDAVTCFYGSDEWRSLATNRLTSAQGRSFRWEMELLYADRLRAVGWCHVRRQRNVAVQGKRYLYRMLFATNHPVAQALSDWEAVDGGDERQRGQLILEL